MESSATQASLTGQIHVGVVVRDMEKTMGFLSSALGIGPWDTNERHYPPEQVLVGKGPFAYRVAFASLGPIQLELIEVLEGETIHSEFLRTHGEGLHHIGFRVPDVDAVVGPLEERGVGVVQSAFREGARYAYMDPAELGGIMLEFVQRAGE